MAPPTISRLDSWRDFPPEDADRWHVGKMRPGNGDSTWTMWNEAHEILAEMADDDMNARHLHPWPLEANEIIDFITELVHEIERLQGELIDKQLFHEFRVGRLTEL